MCYSPAHIIRSLLQTLELKPPRVLLLGPVEEEYSGNNSGRALFLFRNLVSNSICINQRQTTVNTFDSHYFGSIEVKIKSERVDYCWCCYLVRQVQIWELQLHHFHWRRPSHWMDALLHFWYTLKWQVSKPIYLSPLWLHLGARGVTV